MPKPANLLKAELREIVWTENQQAQLRDKRIEVQFNPESLKVSLSNQKAGGDQRGGSATQFVGQGTSKLSFDLWFDVSAPPPRRVDENGQPDEAAVNDVRKLTREVGYFIRPQKQSDDKYVAPGVRFSWGTFWFDGIMESLNETLDFFSEDGRPLRAQLSVSLSQQEIQFNVGEQASPALGSTPPPGTRPQTPVRDGDTMQTVAAKSGRQEQWQGDALRNNVENPRRLAIGQPLDMSGRGPSARIASPSLGVTAASVTRRPGVPVNVSAPTPRVSAPNVRLLG